MNAKEKDIVKRLESKWHLDGASECRFRHVKNETERFVPHCHDYYEIFLMIKGNALHSINGKINAIEVGSLIFIRKDDVHDYKSVNGPFEFANLAFSENTLFDLFDYLGEGFLGERLLTSEFPPERKLTVNEAKKLYLKLAELNTVNFSDSAKLKFKMRKLLCDIFSDYFENSAEADSEIPFWLENAYRKMRDPKNFIAGKDRLFELAGKTREHTTRCVKKYYGTTPTDYVNELRLSYAANLLLSSNLNVTDVCYECGFQNVSWFYNEFTKRFGMSPGGYKKKENKNNE